VEPASGHLGRVALAPKRLAHAESGQPVATFWLETFHEQTYYVDLDEYRIGGPRIQLGSSFKLGGGRSLSHLWDSFGGRPVAVYAVSKDQPRRIYLYKFLFQGDSKLQSAWSYWETNDGKSVIGVDLVDSDLYAVIQYSDGVYLERIVTHPETVDVGTTVEMLLDRKVSEASCTVALTTPSGLDTQSTITLPYPINTTLSNMAVVGRFFAGNSLAHGQVVQILSSTAAGGAGGNGTLTVRGDLTAAKFFVGELYDMLYEFSTQYLKEQPPGGGMAVIAGPKLQLRTWTMLFDKSSAFSIKITPRGRDTMTYPYTGFEVGDQEISLGELALRSSKFRVPVMAQNIEAKIEVVSSSPLPCRLQSAEWEGFYHTRAARL